MMRSNSHLNIILVIAYFILYCGLKLDEYCLGFSLSSALETLKYELVLAFLGAIVIYLIITLNKLWMRWLLAVPLFIMNVIYVFDIGVHREVACHLMWADIVNFNSDFGNFGTNIVHVFSRPQGWFSLLLCISPLLVALIPTERRRLPMEIIMGLGLVTSTVFFNSDYGNKLLWPHYYNVFQVNSGTVNYVNYGYSDSYLEEHKWQARYREGGQPHPPKNVILLVVESLGVANSDYFSGLKNWVPEIDELARHNIVYKNYFTNGYMTNLAHFAILNGLNPFASKNPVSSPKFNNYSLIKQLQAAGYQSYAFYSAEEVGNLNSLFAGSGFTMISDGDDPAYLGIDRQQMKSVPDHLVLQNVLNKQPVGNKSPYLIMVDTITTHNPCELSRGRFDCEAAYRYTSKAIRDFVDKLRERDFFENGLLFITGDHHAYEELSEGEVEKFGGGANMRVPLIIVDGHSNYVSNQPMDHVSLGQLIHYMAIGTYRVHQFQQAPVPEDQPLAGPILYQNKEPREDVTIFYKGKFSTFKLNGESTELPEDLFTDEEEIDILSYIAWLRSK